MLIARRINTLTLRSLAVRSSLFAKDFSDNKKDDSDSDSDRDVKKPKSKPIEKETAADRLNKLLASMQTDDNLTMVKDVNMAKPGGNKRRQKKGDESKNVFEAAKRVASLLGEENQQLQTESELLAKLLNHGEVPSSSAQSNKEDKINPNELSLSELIVGMKIDRRQPDTEYSRGDYVRKTLASRSGQRPDITGDRGRSRHQQKRQAEPHTGSVDLFGGKPLEVFKDPSKLRDTPDILETWKHISKHELKLAIAHPPTNYFQKMALWTEQGKLWKFPVDNEQGLDEEAATDFSEHVFLEQHLEPWCPTRGPVRHFMELVCVGLSKSPYISAREKKEHILWYRDYFEEKKDILREVIVEQKDTPDESKKISAS